MYYKIINDGPSVGDNETLLILDEDLLVAVSCIVKRIAHSNDQAYHAKARHIDEHGETKRDAHGQFVQTEHQHTACPQELAMHGDKIMRKEVMLLVLGEDGTIHDEGHVIDFDPRIRETASVRRAIASSAATFASVRDVL